MIKIAVVGYGVRSKHIMGWIRNIYPAAQLCGIIDRAPEKVANLLREDEKSVPLYEKLSDLMESQNPDGLIIGTDCNSHTAFAIEASKYDIPVFLEKPVSTSMEQAISLEKAFSVSKVPVVVSFPLRLSSYASFAKEKIQQNLLGNPEHIMSWNYPPVGTNYFDRPERNYPISGGLFLQKATHDIDCMIYLMGTQIVRVSAMWTRGHVFGGDKPKGLKCSNCSEAHSCPESPENRLRNKSWNNSPSGGRISDHQCVFGKDIGDIESGMNEDSSSILAEFENGSHGIYTQVFFARRVKKRGFRISGYQGTLEFDWYGKMNMIYNHKLFKEDFTADEASGHFGGDPELAFDFINVIKDRNYAIRSTIWDGIQSAYTCLAARESAQTMKYVQVRQVGQNI